MNFILKWLVLIFLFWNFECTPLFHKWPVMFCFWGQLLLWAFLPILFGALLIILPLRLTGLFRIQSHLCLDNYHSAYILIFWISLGRSYILCYFSFRCYKCLASNIQLRRIRCSSTFIVNFIIIIVSVAWRTTIWRWKLWSSHCALLSFGPCNFACFLKFHFFLCFPHFLILLVFGSLRSRSFHVWLTQITLNMEIFLNFTKYDFVVG